MKKLLALVLALVMTLSLCVVSSNAKFDDAADFTYGEAIDVMSAVGVFVGDGSGKFDAKANLTRAQAAKVIAYLDLGESVAEALPAVQMFSDVPATHWAAKYIAYCADAEIVAGIGNGQFAPEAQVTGYQFAKMLLVVLGYDVEIEKLVGMNWSISTAKLVKEDKLSKGFKGSLNDGLTREGAAQLAFRAIQANPVDTYTGYGLKVNNNNEIVTSGNGKAVKSGSTLAFDLWHDGTKALLTKHDNADDNLMNPAHKWVWKNAKVGTYKDTPVLTYTTEWTWAQAKEDLAELGVEIDTVGNNVTVNVAVYGNGVLANTYAPATMKTLIKDNTKQGGNGVVTNFYEDSDDYLCRVTGTVYTLAEVKTVTKDKSSTKLVNEAALTFEIKNDDCVAFTYKFADDTVATTNRESVRTAGATVTWTADEDTIGFSSVYDGVEEGDYFLVACATKGTKTYNADESVKTYDYSDYVQAIVAPVVKEGKLTANGSKSCKLDGEAYTKSYSGAKTGADRFNVDTTEAVKLFCDEYGYAYGSNILSSSSKLVFVTDVYLALEKGKMVTMAELTYADGTTGDVKIDNDANVKGNSGIKNEVCICTEDSNGLYKVNAVGTTSQYASSTPIATAETTGAYYVTNDTIKAGAVKLVDRYFADDVKTVFCYSNSGSSVYKTVVADGVKEIKKDSKVFFTVNSKGEIDALFVLDKPANTITGTDGIIFLADKTNSFKTKNNDGDTVTVYSYDAYKNGVLQEVFVSEDSATVGLFYELEDDIDLENGFILSGNEYTFDEDKDDIGFAYGYTISADVERTNVIELENAATGGADTLKINANTVFVDYVDDAYDVEDLSSLVDHLDNTALKAQISALYDTETGYALYVYIGKIATALN